MRFVAELFAFPFVVPGQMFSAGSVTFPTELMKHMAPPDVF